MSIAVHDEIEASPGHQAALDFLAAHVDYERALSVPYGEAEFRLDRMRELLRRLGSPQTGQQIVHIAGTKGKGSTAAMISSILTASGRRTAMFTSPHLDRVEERMAVDGMPCSAEELAALVEQVRPVVEAMDADAETSGLFRPTYFEITTAMALCHFAAREVDATVLEVGLGGRLDSTNVCQPVVSVITSISFDHMEQLGNTLAAIAGEKAGIIKPGVPVISGVVEPEPRDVIRGVAADRGSRLVELGRDFSFTYRPPLRLDQTATAATMEYRGDGRARDIEDVALGLAGRHQGSNAAVAIAAACELERLGWTIGNAAIRQGLRDARCAARVEVIRRRPTVVVDAAHNVAAVEALLATLGESFAARRRILVFATTRHKDYVGMLRRLLPAFDDVIFTRYGNNPRGIPPEELAGAAAELGRPETTVTATANEAWRHALASADEETLVCVTGSFFIAAEVRQLERGRDS